MKYIAKNIHNEPESLKIYRNSTPNPSYSGFVGKRELHQVLLTEQGYICAYCNNRIKLDLNNQNKPQVEIEHYKPQDKFPEESLIFTNMLGVCNGKIMHSVKLIEHCDKSKKSYELKVLNPIDKNNSENLISYDLNGFIKSKFNNSVVEDDLKLLNLNNNKLVQYRKIALDKAKADFKKSNAKKSNKRWNTEMFDNVIENYKSKNEVGMYKPFCQYIIWYFELLKTKKKYSQSS